MNLHQRACIASLLVVGPAALVIWAGTYLVYDVSAFGVNHAAHIAPQLILGAVLFGVPVLACTLSLVAIALYLFLRRSRPLPLKWALVAGAGCGLLVRAGVETLWAQPEIAYVPAPVVLIVGVATAGLWWHVWSRDVDARKGRLSR